MDNNQQQQAFPPRIKLGGVWAHETRNGKVFFSGDFGVFGQIQIWPNEKRPGKKDPDMMVYICEKQQKKEGVNSADYVNQFRKNNRESDSSFMQNLPTSTYMDGTPAMEAPALTDADIPF